MKIHSDLVEVVSVECADCGLISNFLDDWEAVYDDVFGYWYYLCPACSRI
jgi:hypothetical protein